jgi:DNA-binding transcriptional LysR family regulator
MEIRHLATFKAVADRLSFIQAAQDLHYAQSTVSAQIASLEEELGVRLFDRLGRRILLTEAGEALYPYAGRMLELAQTARAEVMEEAEVTGSLSVRVPESLAVHRLQPAIAEFRRRMPKVLLSFITCAQESLLRDLASGVVDLAFLLSESMSSADLEMEALAYEELVLVAAPDHPLAAAAKLSTADLAGHTLLLTRVDCSYRRVLERMLAELGAQTGMLVEFNSVAAAIACAANGQGVTILPRMAAAESLSRGDLRELAWEEKGLEVAVLMIWHRERWLSPAQKCFMDAARQGLRG